MNDLDEQQRNNYRTPNIRRVDYETDKKILYLSAKGGSQATQVSTVWSEDRTNDTSQPTEYRFSRPYCDPKVSFIRLQQKQLTQKIANALIATVNLLDKKKLIKLCCAFERIKLYSQTQIVNCNLSILIGQIQKILSKLQQSGLRSAIKYLKYNTIRQRKKQIACQQMVQAVRAAVHRRLQYSKREIKAAAGQTDAKIDCYAVRKNSLRSAGKIKSRIFRNAKILDFQHHNGTECAQFVEQPPLVRSFSTPSLSHTKVLKPIQVQQVEARPPKKKYAQARHYELVPQFDPNYLLHMAYQSKPKRKAYNGYPDRIHGVQHE